MSAAVSRPQPVQLPIRTNSDQDRASPLTPGSPDDDGNLSPDLDQDGVEDQDGAHAVMQPAMSAAASHLTSPHTPAMEKAAALEKAGLSGIFDLPLPEEDEPEEDDGAKTMTPASPVNKSDLHLGEMPRREAVPPPARAPLPSPWHTGPKTLQVKDSRQNRLRPSRGVLESAFGPTRSRSRSAGQEALKRLSKAFPSFSTSSHLLPSFGSSFFSSTDKSSSPTSPPVRPIPGQRSLSSNNSLSQASGAPRPRHVAPPPSGVHRRSSSIQSGTQPLSASVAHRPPILRRVTSDESILYHSLSRASSLGDDDQFQDVREMVNMRLQAIKESLPERPNFKIPSLPRIHTPSFISMNSSSDGLGGASMASRSPNLENGTSTPHHGHTELDAALEDLTGDIVIMGGLRGSVLRFAEAPYQQCWAPVKLGFNMRKVNLEVGLEEEDEEKMEDSIKPSGMLSHIGPIDISRKLIKKLRHCDNARTGKLRVWDYGYDWRLSPHILSRKLREFLEKLPSNQPGVAPEARGAVVIAHSLGGMITRHAVNQRPELFSGVVYAGVPQRCINILGPLRNGDVVLLNEKLLSAQVNFSMRTSFVFLPEDGFCFVDKNTGEEYPVDFFDPQEWAKWSLSPCMGPVFPAYNRPAQGSGSPSLSSLLPTSLRARAASSSEKWFGTTPYDPQTNASTGHKDRTLAPQMYPGNDAQPSTPDSPPPSSPEHARYMTYLTRVLADTKKFRHETFHIPSHTASNAYPPLSLIYGKSTPTVYAAQVSCREAIPCADAYDDLLFRAGDGVVLAKEAMLPEGYAVVKGGRVSTERGHITMLGDMDAVGKSLRAVIRGRRKGIGLGNSEKVEST